MKRGWIKYLVYSFVVIVVGGLFLFLIQLGYSYSWTGFAEFTPSNPDTVRSKTLWDWMELLIIPVVLAGGAILLNRSERALERKTAEDRARLERDLATDRQREAALQTYFDRMSELLLKEKLRTTKKVEVRDVARTRTLSIMRVLDTKRNEMVIQFLREAGLITDENSIFIRAIMNGINLEGLNLKGVNLKGANLEGANFQSARLEGANLEYTILERAILKDANLGWANLAGADLSNASLEDAYLAHANLQAAEMWEANLQGTVMWGANLKSAEVTPEQLAKVKTLTNATMTNGKKHD